MDWQTAVLIGLGFLGGVVTTSLRRPRQLESAAAAPAAAPEPASLPEEDMRPQPTPTLQGTPPDEPKALAYERLSQLERFKSGFLARTAHELRSPINSVIGLHQLILEGLCETPEEEKQFTAEAKEAAYKVLQLFDTIIAASKLDIGREVPTLEPIALKTLFQTLEELTHLQAANSNVRLTLKPTDLSVVSDLKWLQMMLISLIDDAITSTKLGDITLEAFEEGEYVILRLEADRPVDDLSVRLDTSLYGREVDLSNLSSVYLSTGLTLAVAQEMVKSLNGDLLLPTAADVPIITVKLPATM
ncbi:histidine kinase [Leptolyngbya sp. Heron Island J]|uniref:sensor histidine kinase n=1 Tax=Leptolyngbya sp. Heron Island J TaxID=1385935 RepID=UPI0003B9AD3A|nr:HAMP domain-containing sensor histidine kinase [Leptolyngbya sp. Heron Island J]ESA33284.1 histidine kinase [Leptolyngbya sp. Heron Island J]